VEVPPFDAPWVQMTSITDPQGATFTASKFHSGERAKRAAESGVAANGSLSRALPASTAAALEAYEKVNHLDYHFFRRVPRRSH